MNLYKKIINHYKDKTSSAKMKHLKRVLGSGNLKNTGNIIIMDAGETMREGPDVNFFSHRMFCDPEYLSYFAFKSGVNALTLNLGSLMASSGLVSKIPVFLQVNSSFDYRDILSLNDYDYYRSSMISSAEDAFNHKCVGVKFNLLVGAIDFNDQIENLKELVADAKKRNLLVMVRSRYIGKTNYVQSAYIYNSIKSLGVESMKSAEEVIAALEARLSKVREEESVVKDSSLGNSIEFEMFVNIAKFTLMQQKYQNRLFAEGRQFNLSEMFYIIEKDITPKTLDHVSYGAYLAASMGADIVVADIPNECFYSNKIQNKHRSLSEAEQAVSSSKEYKFAHVKNNVFNGKTITLFASSDYKSEDDVMNDINAIKLADGVGVTINKNLFYRDNESGVALLERINQSFKQK